MTDHWEVELRINGEEVLLIGNTGYLAGDPDIAEKADIVRDAAEHLIAFIGPEEPQPCFYCGGEVVIETDNNGPIVPCPICSP